MGKYDPDIGGVGMGPGTGRGVPAVLSPTVRPWCLVLGALVLGALVLWCLFFTFWGVARPFWACNSLGTHGRAKRMKLFYTNLGSPYLMVALDWPRAACSVGRLGTDPEDAKTIGPTSFARGWRAFNLSLFHAGLARF